MTADDEEHPAVEPGAAGGPGEGSPGSRGLRLRGRLLPVLLLRVALVLVVAGGVLELQAAGTYLVPAGSVSFQVRPAWPGGHLVMPLGPAGELSLRTHRTPVDVVMDYRLPAQTAALLDGSSSRELPRLEGGARAAFTRYLEGRVPWLLRGGRGRRAAGRGRPDAAAPAVGRRRRRRRRAAARRRLRAGHATRPWTARRRCGTRGSRHASRRCCRSCVR